MVVEGVSSPGGFKRDQRGDRGQTGIVSPEFALILRLQGWSSGLVGGCVGVGVVDLSLSWFSDSAAYWSLCPCPLTSYNK